MKNKVIFNNRYIAILMVLLVVVGMLILIHFGILGIKKNFKGKTTLEQEREYVRQAKETKTLIESTVQSGE